MDKFEIGQRVVVLDNEAAFDWFVEHLSGTEFVVMEVVGSLTRHTVLNGWAIPPAACQLVVVDHVTMYVLKHNDGHYYSSSTVSSTAPTVYPTRDKAEAKRDKLGKCVADWKVVKWSITEEVV